MLPAAMASAAPNHDTRELYGPFHRRTSETQTAETCKLQLASGEAWGKVPRQRARPAVQAIAGPLPPGQSGFEFWAFAAPDVFFGPMAEWRKEAPYVTIDQEELVKLSVAITRVSEDLLQLVEAGKDA